MSNLGFVVAFAIITQVVLQPIYLFEQTIAHATLTPRVSVVSTSNNYILVAGDDTNARLYSLAGSTYNLYQTLTNAQQQLEGADISVDQKYIVTGGNDQTPRVYTCTSFPCTFNKNLGTTDTDINAIKISSTSKYVVAGTASSKLYYYVNASSLWDNNNNINLGSTCGSGVNSLAIHQSEALVVVGCGDSNVGLAFWNSGSSTFTVNGTTFGESTKPVLGVDISNNIIASASQDSKLRIYKNTSNYALSQTISDATD